MSSQSRSAERNRADYGFARARDLAFDAVQSLWRKRQQSGMKQMDIAIALGRDPAWVNRVLRGPGNWTLRTIGELMEALNGELEISAHGLEEAISPAPNYDAYVDYGPKPAPASASGNVSATSLTSSPPWQTTPSYASQSVVLEG